MHLRSALTWLVCAAPFGRARTAAVRTPRGESCLNSLDDLSSCGCECILVDVGLNTGDTLLGWPLGAAALLKRRGGQEANGITRHAAASSKADALAKCAHADSCYLGFEPNPLFTARLQEQQAALRAGGIRVSIFTGTALAVADGTATFYAQDTPPERAYNTTFENVGSSLEPGRQVTGFSNGSFFKSRTTAAAAYKHVQVATIGATRLFEQLAASKAKFVALKLDVEGTEFRLLRSVLLRNPKALCALDVLAVEWHPGRLIGKSAVPAWARRAIEWLLNDESCKVQLLGWH